MRSEPLPDRRPGRATAGWAAILAALGCGRVGFDPASGAEVDGGTAANAGPCAGAPRIAAGAHVGTVHGARDELDPPSGCGDGTEVVYRFTGPSRYVELRITAEFEGNYSVGPGCPPTIGPPAFQCGLLVTDTPSSWLGRDVDSDTYLVIDRRSGERDGFEVTVTE